MADDLASGDGTATLTLGHAIRDGIENGVGLGAAAIADKWIATATLLFIASYWFFRAWTAFRVWRRHGRTMQVLTDRLLGRGREP